MNRRDIIIVAVLINAGLLVTLFVSSLKRGQGTDLALSPKKAQQIEIVATPLSPKQGMDQIDQVISQYTAMAKTKEKKKNILPPPVLTPAPKKKEKALASSLLRVIAVEKGDVLEKIARTHGVSVNDINSLKFALMHVKCVVP